MIDFTSKDWVNHIIVATGIIFGILILIGFYISLKPFIHSARVLQNNAVVTQDKNSQQVYIDVGNSFVLELPSATYPKENLTILADPQGTLVRKEETDASTEEMWALELKALRPGKAEVSVKSVDGSVSDFHYTVTVQ